ncbi:hypothetical protein FOPG_12916 [Fusarium oxysporum f. sp. conglutinans race 2 54008]|uniref:Uncharacterized protein n=1 Tax=Fusarium oxysporum f. sp. conglutinans race 2 54008 TaxID=1089457 RepID=X0H5G6_FUSOX|nr:hypothetical protein FOPG_12916 [Fusarium oxysporum f. sp. conglutinans race 2 54008]
MANIGGTALFNGCPKNVVLQAKWDLQSPVPMVFLAKNPRGEMRRPLFGNRLIAKITPMGGLIAEPHYNNALVYGVLRAATSVQRSTVESRHRSPSL